MCSISGIVGARHDVDLKRYYKAHQTLRHRGPDDEGFVAFESDGPGKRYSGGSTCPELIDASPQLETARPPNCVLGQHRLSIIDISSAGHQPMFHEGLWLVYNGEVYNYLELRQELIALGYEFSSKTDSEVVLKAYHCWGKDAFSRFNGMWALAIWNENSNSLLLCRDRFGVKPLYYANVDNQLFFASETKFFRSLIRVTPHEGRMRDFVFSSLLDHEAETMLEPIKQLLPAHILEFCPRNNLVNETRYWSVPTGSSFCSDEEAIEQFQALFDSAIDLRLRSDVPLGGLLSGGLDSSAIVSNLAARGKIPEQGLSVFAAVFPEWIESEHELVNETVRRYPQIALFNVVPSAKQFLDRLPSLLYQVDFPFRSPAVYSQNLLYEKVRKESDIVVLLNGQGADEIFAGYQGQRLPRIASAMKRLDMPDAWREMQAHSKLNSVSTKQVFRSALKTLFGHLRNRYFPHAGRVVVADMGKNPFTALLTYNLTYASLPEYLRYEDRNSMNFSCETRLPFLDYRLVEWAFRLNERFKIRNGESKYVQRQAIASYVPEKIVKNPVKKGFVSPQQEWQLGPMKNWLENRIANHGIGFLKPDLLENYKKNPQRNYYELWRIACMAEWLDVQKNPPSVDCV